MTDGVGDVLALPDNEILVSHVAVMAGAPGPTHGLIKLRESGAPDTTFGQGGFAASPVRTAGGSLNSLALQTDRKIVLGGTATMPDGTREFMAARFTAGGVLDASFSGDGYSTVVIDPTQPVKERQDFVGGAAVGPDGHILLAGYGGVPFRLSLAKLQSGPPTPRPVGLGPDGTLYVGGTDSADAIDLEWVPGPAGDLVRVRMNGATSDFDHRLVRRVAVGAGDGPDRVSVASDFTRPLHVDGGDAGRAIGSHDSVTLNGTAGPDSVVAGPAGVTVSSRMFTFDGVEAVGLNLSGGNDEVDVQPDTNIDTVIIDAGDGDDRVRLHKGISFNVTGGPGNDVVHMHDGGVGRFDGGGGADTATFDGTAGRDQVSVHSGAAIGAEPSEPHSGLLRDAGTERQFVPAELRFEKLESLHVFGFAGSDSTNVDLRLGVNVHVHGGGGESDYLLGTDLSGGDMPYQYAVSGTSILRDGAPGGLQMTGMEIAGLQTGGGPAHVTVTPHASTRLIVDGDHDLLPNSGGDRLALDIQGASGARLTRGTAGNGTFTFANRQPVEFKRFEHVDTVAGRHVFYNRSAYDGGDAAANAADDGAIATDRVFRLPGEPAHHRHISNYSRGINGIMIDVIGLPDGAELAADDFTFRTGTTADPSTWSPAPAPAQVTLRRGAGVAGSDRITLTWPDGAVRNTWLEVTIKPTSDTGLTDPDVFYFGNLVGETGDHGTAGAAAAVTSRDLLRVRRKLFSAAPIGSTLDFDRDGRVGVTDWLLVRPAAGRSLPTISSPLTAPPSIATSLAGQLSRAVTTRRGTYDVLR